MFEELPALLGFGVLPLVPGATASLQVVTASMALVVGSAEGRYAPYF